MLQPAGLTLSGRDRRCDGLASCDDDSTLDLEDFPIACPKCSVQMRLFAIEWETERRDLYTFICDWCGHAVARGVSMQ
jgi:hypothetical protein